MSGEQLIPNAVGRLDDVVEALREGRKGDAVELLWSRAQEVGQKGLAAQREYDKAANELRDIMQFLKKTEINREFAERVRVACGGGVSTRDTSPDRGLEST